LQANQEFSFELTSLRSVNSHSIQRTFNSLLSSFNNTTWRDFLDTFLSPAKGKKIQKIQQFCIFWRWYSSTFHTANFGYNYIVLNRKRVALFLPIAILCNGRSSSLLYL